jgi:DNA recombination protein RmuC
MDPSILGILVALVVLIILVLIPLLRKPSGDLSAKFDAAIKEQFLAFQSNIHNELNTTREEVTRSKDLISEHTIKTIETIKDIGGIIHKLGQQQEEAQKLGQSLKDILQAPKLRGSYGEVILEEMLEKVLPKGIWERQHSIDGQERVDVVVKIKDVVIPIDAKFPRDNYRRYLDAASPEERAKYWKDYEKDVKDRIKTISTKYIKPEKGTSDFALMFIPSEAIYYETIAENNFLGEPSKIYEFAQENKVIPVSPNTFYAFLQIIVIGTRNLEIIKSAKKLQDGLTTLQKSFELFYQKYEEMGKNIQKAAEAYRVGDGHIERYKHRLDSTLQLEEFREDVNSLPEGKSGD